MLEGSQRSSKDVVMVRRRLLADVEQCATRLECHDTRALTGTLAKTAGVGKTGTNVRWISTDGLKARAPSSSCSRRETGEGKGGVLGVRAKGERERIGGREGRGTRGRKRRGKNREGSEGREGREE